MAIPPLDKAVMVDVPPSCITERMDGSNIVHMLCLRGNLSFRMKGDEYMIEAGQMMVWRNPGRIEEITLSDDFECRNVVLDSSFFEICCPRNGYDAKAQLSLALNPVVSLDPGMMALCVADIDAVARRLADTSHAFINDAVISAMRMLVIDVQHLVHQRGEFVGSNSHHVGIVHRFLSMLDNGDYVSHRDVGYYAERLAISPKYFSEICKIVSGRGASYWINRYAAIGIARCLQNTDMSVADMAEKFNFTSVGYFSRFVFRELGVRPADIRRSIGDEGAAADK